MILSEQRAKLMLLKDKELNLPRSVFESKLKEDIRLYK